LCDGHEHAASFATFRLGVQVRAEFGHETYVAVSITGAVPARDFVFVVLAMVPGCQPADWDPVLSLPERDELFDREEIWFNLMDPTAAAKLLDEEN
jgi:hypothetical protein